MIAIFILALIAVVTCVLGIAFIIHGAVNTPDIDKFVPSDDVNKIKSELTEKEEHEQQLKLQLDNLVLELEATKSKLSDVKNSETESEALKAQEQDYQKKIQDLEEKLRFIRNKADEQAKESIDAITTLDEVNKELKEEIVQMESLKADFDPRQLETLNNEKNMLQEKLDANAKEIEGLQAQLGIMKSTSENERDKATSNVSALTGENEKLRDGIKSITQKILDISTALAAFKSTNEKKLAVLSERSRQLEAEITPLRSEIDANQKKIEDFKNQVAVKSREAVPIVAGKDIKIASDNRSQMTQPEDWGKLKASLETNIKHLTDINNRLIEKEKMLQFELTKSRAQAYGLEKICHEFQAEIERQQKQ